MESVSESDGTCQTDQKLLTEPGPSGITPVKRASRRLNCQLNSSACPVCGISIKISEAETHFELELRKLEEISTPRETKKSITDKLRSHGSHQERKDVIKEIRRNRSKRITQRTLPPHKRRKLPGEVVCPICHEQLNHLTEEDRLVHANSCLNSQNGPSTSLAEDVDIVGESSESDFEEYEWAGHTRVRALSLANLIPKNNVNGQEEDVGDLDVDGEEDQSFGAAQFTESDLISTSIDDPSQKVRVVMARTTVANNGRPPELASKWQTQEDLSVITDNLDEGKIAAPSDTVVVASLKRRIQELELQLNSKSTRCLVCLEAYTDPLVSVACWHVYCQDCWLKTLSCKKLCPQCSMITNPGDLRRLYL